MPHLRSGSTSRPNYPPLGSISSSRGEGHPLTGPSGTGGRCGVVRRRPADPGGGDGCAEAHPAGAAGGAGARRPGGVRSTSAEVVVPPGREGEARPGGVTLAIWLDRVVGRASAEEAALEEILLPAAAGCSHLGASSARLLVLEEWLQDPDRGVERQPRRAVGSLTVPAAVGKLLGEQPVADPPNILPEVGADRHPLAVDARLDLAVKEGVAVAFRRAAPLPRLPVADKAHCAPRHPTVRRSPGGRAAARPNPRWRPWRARPRLQSRARRSGRAAPASGSTGPHRAASR